MKNTLNIALRAAICTALAALVIGCSSPLTPPKVKQQAGDDANGVSVTLSINGGGGSRTIMPASSAFAHYSVRFVKQNSDFEVSVNNITSTTPVISGLQIGNYAVTVEGFNGAGNLIGRKVVDEPVEITKAGPNTLAVTLEPLATGNGIGSGTFAWNITILPEIATATMIVRAIDAAGVGAEIPVINITDLAATNNDSRSISAGAYRVVFTFGKTGSAAVSVTELLYVYTNLTSTYTKSYGGEVFLTGGIAAVLAEINSRYVSNSWSTLGSSDPKNLDNHFRYLEVLHTGTTLLSIGNVLATVGADAHFTGINDLRWAVDAALIELGKGGLTDDVQSAVRNKIAAMMRNASAYSLSQSKVGNQNVTTITVGPAGSKYKVVVTGLTVTVDPGDIPDYLDEDGGGDTPDDPIDLPLSAVDLYGNATISGVTATNWVHIRNALETKGKYVNLDLSRCLLTTAGTSERPTIESNYNTTNRQNMFMPYRERDGVQGLPTVQASGEAFIVSLVLPTAATYIEAGGQWPGIGEISSFRNFIHLKEIKGTGVTNIGPHAFRGDFRGHLTGNIPFILETADFPNATTLGYDCFRNCYYLKNLSFRTNATISGTDNQSGFPGTIIEHFTINGTGGTWSVMEGGALLIQNGNTLYAYPTASGDVTLNAAITGISANVFKGNTNLIRITSSSVTRIGNSTFENCTELLTASFSDVRNIGSGTFRNCVKLTQVNFPNAVEILDEAFKTCSALTSVTFSKSATVIGNAFQDCNKNLQFTLAATQPTNQPMNLWLAENNQAVFRDTGAECELILYPFAEGVVNLDNVDLSAAGAGKHINSIYRYVFIHNTDITSVSSSYITQIKEYEGANAFQGCTKLASVSLPLVTTVLGDAPFSGCTLLNFIDIRRVSNFRTYAFADMGTATALTIRMGMGTPVVPAFVSPLNSMNQSNSNTGTPHSVRKSVTVAVPAGVLNTFQTARVSNAGNELWTDVFAWSDGRGTAYDAAGRQNKVIFNLTTFVP